MKVCTALPAPALTKRQLVCAVALALFTLLLLASPHTRVRAAAGDLDPTFGTGGRLVYDFTPPDVTGDLGHDPDFVLIQPDGKILLTLHAPKSASSHKSVYLVRLNLDGTLEPNFGNGGKLFIDPSFFSGVAIALQDDGRILLAGGISAGPGSLCALIRLNSDGSLDTTFGNAGRAITELFAGLLSQHPALNEGVGALAIQPNGKIIVLARAQFFDKTFRYRTAIARFNSDGTLDNTFGAGGIVGQTPFASDVDGSPQNLILHPDGKFTVCWIFPDDIKPQVDIGDPLARYNADGTLDSTFATNALLGKSLSDIKLQADGKIVVTTGIGAACCPIDQGFQVARVNPSGSLDTSFGGTGIVSVQVDNNPFHPGVANALVVQADGKIVAAGVTGGNVNFGDDHDFALARLNPNGSLDPTFGNAGTIRTDFPASDGSFTWNGVQDLALQLDGKILAFGLTAPPHDTNYKLALARYVAAGATPTIVQFSSPQFTVGEGCVARTVTVTRSGDTTGTTTVDFATVDASARQKSDYTLATGTLKFGPGETSKDISVLISEDGRAEGLESFTLALNNPQGAAIGAQGTTVLQIIDNETTDAPANPIDEPATFVGQHYHDFINRQADSGGQAFWTDQLTQCGTNQQCLAARRVNISTAFFLSIELQRTGFLVIRLYKTGLGDQSANPRFAPFMRDAREIGEGVVVGVGNWEEQLKNNGQQFTEEFVTRAEFRAAHDLQTADQYVTSLFSNAAVIPTAAERNAALTAFGTGDSAGRARALLSVVESGSVYNKLYNKAFVLMQYFGYLRRNPDGAPDNSYAGYDFWLAKLDSFTLLGEDMRDATVAANRVKRAEMVRAFIESTEYRERFSVR